MKRPIFLGNVEIRDDVSTTCLSVSDTGNTCKCRIYFNAHQYRPLMLNPLALEMDI